MASKTYEEREQSLLDQLENSALTSGEIKLIEQKLEILRAHAHQ